MQFARLGRTNLASCNRLAIHVDVSILQSGDPILDSINEGVFTVDSGWRITAFNRAAERITGVRRQQALGRRCPDVFRASICENACALRRTLSTGKPIQSAAGSIINAAGERIPIRISTALLRDAGGKVIGGVETFQDLSQIEQLRKELESRYSFEDIAGRSPAMRNLFEVLPGSLPATVQFRWKAPAAPERSCSRAPFTTCRTGERSLPSR